MRGARAPRARRLALPWLATLAACSGSCGERGGPRGSVGAATPLGTAPPDDAGSDAGALSRPSADVVTGEATSVGATGVSFNGRVHTHGRPARAWFEYGETAAYGAATEPRWLPPPLEAHYRETWDKGLAGWAGGVSGKDLVHRAAGGASRGYVAYTDPRGFGDDVNHLDGLGTVHLAQYVYPGTFPGEPSVALGGGAPDLRDARVKVHLRGRAFVGRGAELGFWLQSDADLAKQDTNDWRRTNWAFTGRFLTDALRSGAWERVEYTLPTDSTQWSYAGRYVAQQRPNYVYWPIEDALGRVSTDFFHMLVLVDRYAEPSGGIDFDELEVIYRNHSLVRAAAGAKLVRVTPPSEDAAERLVDGHRHGDGRAWTSAANPTNPVEIVYELASGVVVERVQLHQHLEWPSDEVDVATSDDGASWAPLAQGHVPKVGPRGPNHAYWLAADLAGRGRYLRVAIRSGHRKERWGLGEIEVFGRGPRFATEDGTTTVSRDAVVRPGRAVHYRLVVEGDTGRLVGEDRTFAVPDGRLPAITTGGAPRVGRKEATVEARVTPLGSETTVRVEYGADTTYGKATPEVAVGLEETPRTVRVQLAELAPSTTWHYRFVATGPRGSAFGADATLVTAP